MPTQHLEAVIADTEEARRLNYRLRYQVFCRETNFEDPSHYPDHEEKDEFDPESIHFLVRDGSTDEWIGAARLVLPTPSRLPIQHLSNVADDNPAFPFKDTGEVSRLLMVGAYRQRRENACHPVKHGLDERDRRREPRSVSRSTHRRKTAEVLREMLRAIATYCWDHGIPQVAFLLTPALRRIIGRLGIQITAIGKPCEHRGQRLPCVANIEQVYREFQRQDSEARVSEYGAFGYRLFSELSSPAVERYTADARP